MKVSGLGHFSLGTPVPNKEHAVCVSLPNYDDVIGYEEKKPETLEKLKSGYPRFVRHRRIQGTCEFLGSDSQPGKKRFIFFSEFRGLGLCPKSTGD